METTKKTKPIGGYIAIAVAILLLSFFIPSPKKELKTVIVKYNPSSLDSVVYQVKEGTIRRVGECISFTTLDEKRINLCDKYQEKMVEVE
ncbi:MAG: hypothetical protein AAF632_25880 [Bacteroidota bacterium]